MNATIVVAAIPASHLDLADCPRVAALTTLMPDGAPQTSVVWCDVDDGSIRINCMRGFQKERNMRRDPRVTLLCYDPRRPLRSLEIRGTVVEMTEDGAREHLDALTSRYVGRPTRYFGECIPAEFAATETPVLCRIRPDRVVVLDAEDGRRCADGAEGEPACPCDAVETAESDVAVGRGAAAGPETPFGPEASAVAAPAPATPDVPIPESHLDLLRRPVAGVLTTLLPDGRPQSSLVWVDHDGACASVNTTLQRTKGRDMLRDPRVSLLVVDPDDTSRYVQVRGAVEMVREGAVEHLDRLTRRYTRHPSFYGHVHPEEQRGREARVICRIHATRVTLDAIHR